MLCARTAAGVMFCWAAAWAAATPEEIRLWPDQPLKPEVLKPASDARWAPLPGNFTVTHNSSIYVFLPPADKATGVAMVIAPGGGHRQLVIEKEGWEVAEWLNARGIAAFVLKYRLAKAEGANYQLADEVYADAARAVRLVRSRAAEWKLDPARIGFIGFSAGGEVAGMIGTRFDAGNGSATDRVERVSSRPDFNVLIYPWYRPGANVPGGAPLFPVPANAPPVFLVCADDDRSHVEPTVKFYLELEARHIPTEMHIYASGGHGFGLRPIQKSAPASAWPQRFEEWMHERGILK